MRFPWSLSAGWYLLRVSWLLLIPGAGRSVADLIPQLFDEFRVLLLHLLSELLPSATQTPVSTGRLLTLRSSKSGYARLD